MEFRIAVGHTAQLLHPTRLLVFYGYKVPGSILKDLDARQSTKHIHMINYDDRQIASILRENKVKVEDLYVILLSYQATH